MQKVGCSIQPRRTNSTTLSSKVEQAADNRSTTDRYREGGPIRKDATNERRKQTQGFTDPERKAEWIGAGLLIQSQEDRNLQGSRTTSIKVMQRSLKPLNTGQYRGGPPNSRA